METRTHRTQTHIHTYICDFIFFFTFGFYALSHVSGNSIILVHSLTSFILTSHEYWNKSKCKKLKLQKSRHTASERKRERKRKRKSVLNIMPFADTIATQWFLSSPSPTTNTTPSHNTVFSIYHVDKVIISFQKKKITHLISKIIWRIIYSKCNECVQCASIFLIGHEILTAKLYQENAGHSFIGTHQRV